MRWNPEAVAFTADVLLLTAVHAGTGARTRTSLRTRDFKSRASASFAIPARRTKRTRNGGACAPPYLVQSGKRDSNPRPQPWQGCALPTELFPRASRIYEGHGDAGRWTARSVAGHAERVHGEPGGPREQAG